MNLSVTIPPVRTFAHVEPDREQALKVLEEASEVHGAWRSYEGTLGIDDHIDELRRERLLDECADVIHATINLVAALGVEDFRPWMDECERRSRGEREDNKVSEELRPCPFCRAEAELVRNSSGNYFVRCTNKQCAAKTRLYHENENGACLAWNRRAERTCSVESSHVEQEMGSYAYLEVELSCGHAFTWDDGTPPDYCPHCGARVVSGDD